MAPDIRATHAGIEIIHYTASELGSARFNACLALVQHTSATAYRASSRGWSAKAKRDELSDVQMCFLLAQCSAECRGLREHVGDLGKQGSQAQAQIHGFLAYMLTEEDGMRVVYCYEVHVYEVCRGLGLGVKLMGMMEELGRAAGVQAAMLTVFTSNIFAMEFYKRLGFQKIDEEPNPGILRRLRSRAVEWKPTWIIMSKCLR